MGLTMPRWSHLLRDRLSCTLLLRFHSIGFPIYNAHSRQGCTIRIIPQARKYIRPKSVKTRV